jgi:hypothetical protein
MIILRGMKDLVNNELQRVWKEAVVVWLKVQSLHLYRGTEKIYEIICRHSLRAEMWTRDLYNAKQECWTFNEEVLENLILKCDGCIKMDCK